MKYLALAVLAVLVLIPSSIHAADKAASPRPNILWISCEDTSPTLGCYGDPHAVTPTLDRLAKQGVRYTHAFSTSGVCAPTRSGVITGMYASTVGSHHMRSNATLPDQIKCFPEYLRKAGYYCTNNNKTDYNFRTLKNAWDECGKRAHWKHCPQGKPFFAVFNLHVSHEGQIRASDRDHKKNTRRLTPDQRQNPDRITPPPYHQNTPVSRHDWARYYEIVTAMDYEVADRLEELHKAGLDDDTIVFFWGDQGAGLPRMKCWVYDSGTHAPLIVRIPEKFRKGLNFKPGTVDNQLVSFIDLAPTVLNLAGVPIPKNMQGRAFLGKNLTPPRQYLYGAHDRMDERYETIRMVCDGHYQYLRNYQPHRTYAQYMEYSELMPSMKELRQLHEAGKLTPAADRFFDKTKPIEELYDLTKDPHEINNLADSPQYQKVLERMRAALLQWQDDTKDLALLPEPIMLERAKKYGSEYAIFRQPGAEELMRRLHATVEAGEQGKIDELLTALGDPDAAVRYWALTGLGNHAAQSKAHLPRLEAAMKDPSPTVRVAAARAVCLVGEPQKALPLLVEELKSNDQWIRLSAADVLDEIGPDARPALAAMKQACGDKQNKYVARLCKRAIEELESEE